MFLSFVFTVLKNFGRIPFLFSLSSSALQSGESKKGPPLNPVFVNGFGSNF